MQIAATPFSPFFKAWTRVTTIRLPEDPMGFGSALTRVILSATHMAERHGTTSDVDLLSRKAKDLLSTDGNDREGLVELPERNVVF